MRRPLNLPKRLDGIGPFLCDCGAILDTVVTRSPELGEPGRVGAKTVLYHCAFCRRRWLEYRKWGIGGVVGQFDCDGGQG
jgi:hypothetical protein